MKIVKYYEPDLDEAGFMHDIGTEDYLLYLDNNKKEDKSDNSDYAKCKDCGAPMNEGEAKTFTVCDDCWEKHFA